MAVRIRLRRIGKKKQPQYRLVVAESAAPRDGRFIESIGHYDPGVDPASISVNEERALWWLRQGARASETALSLLKKAGVWEKFSGEAVPAGAAEPTVTAVAAPDAEMAAEPIEEVPPAEGGEEVSEETPEPDPTSD